jgi:outer membrane murein-binding lipoprotein Lpp
VTGLGELFLGVIALSVLVMAAIQVAAIVAGMKLARRVDQLSTQLNQEIKPLIANLTAMAEQASHTASLASHQVERVDRLFGEMATRVDETIAVARQFVRGPARRGLAVLSGVQAAVSAFRDIRAASRRRRDLRPDAAADDDESLFIG